MVYEVVQFSAPTFDEDGSCTDNGPRGAVLFTLDADYPGAVIAQRRDVAKRVIAAGVSINAASFAGLSAVMSWPVIGGGYVAVMPQDQP